jgi:MFS family permease
MPDAIIDQSRESAPLARLSAIALLATIAYQGFVVPIMGLGSPFISRRFGLDTAGLAVLYAWMSLAAPIGFTLGRLIDRLGRRRMLLACVTATSLACAGAAMATTLRVFAAFNLLIFAFVGAAGGCAITIIVEEIPDRERASALGYVGIAGSIGGSICLALMPAFAATRYSYRLAYFAAATGIALVPVLAKLVGESHAWTRAQASGRIDAMRFYSVFSPTYRRRAVAMLTSQLLGTIAVVSVNSWNYYYAVTVVGISSAKASAGLLLGTLFGVVGFRLGAHSAERFGRVRTVVGFGLVGELAVLWNYIGPPAHISMPGVWLATGYCCGAFVGSASSVAGGAAGAELFPTPIRATMGAWSSLVGAAGSLIAQLLIAHLVKPLGGLSYTVAALSMLGPASLIIFGCLIEETAGLSLAVASKESLIETL